MQRVRILYTKGEELLYTGNLDLHKIWERTFRRAGLPLAYSQGFHPQPRLHQACPLPLGFIGQNEILDVWLDSDETIEQISARISTAPQPGLNIINLEIEPLSSPALQTQEKAAIYRVDLNSNTCSPDLNERVDRFLSSGQCLRERRGKTYDLLPLVESLTFTPESLSLLMRLTTLPGATGRPEEVLDVLGIPPLSVPITRTELVLT